VPNVNCFYCQRNCNRCIANTVVVLVIQSVCILDAANLLGWMTIHASWSLLRSFQLTTTEIARSHLMSNLVHVMSKSVYSLYFACTLSAFRTKWHLDPSSRLATTDMGWKLGGYVPFFGGELGPHLTQCGQGPGLLACEVSSWSVLPFGCNTPTLHIDNSLIA